MNKRKVAFLGFTPYHIRTSNYLSEIKYKDFDKYIFITEINHTSADVLKNIVNHNLFKEVYCINFNFRIRDFIRNIYNFKAYKNKFKKELDKTISLIQKHKPDEIVIYVDDIVPYQQIINYIHSNMPESNIMLVEEGTATVLYLLGTSLFVFYNQNPDLLQIAQQDQIFASYIVYQLPVGVSGLVLAAIYAAAQSTLSTGLNSVATSWTLDIQSVITKDMSMEKQTKIAKFISLGVGVVAIVVSIVMANGEIKSAYEWFNSFMGLVLGVLAGIFVLGVFSKNATNIGAYAGFIVSAMVVINLKYNHPEVTSWSYSIITIVTSFIVGNIVSYLYIKVKNVSVNKEETIHSKDIA